MACQTCPLPGCGLAACRSNPHFPCPLLLRVGRVIYFILHSEFGIGLPRVGSFLPQFLVQVILVSLQRERPSIKANLHPNYSLLSSISSRKHRTVAALPGFFLSPRSSTLSFLFPREFSLGAISWRATQLSCVASRSFMFVRSFVTSIKVLRPSKSARIPSVTCFCLLLTRFSLLRLFWLSPSS